ncbi:PAS domain S-box protein, partial [Sphingomonas sp.]|uniref:PAS domain S-box protein n=1 Tax=Sphingomonas sp. TaxID=28214 RepID=UPI0033405B4B
MESLPAPSLDALLATSLDAVVVMGHTGLVADWNDNAQRIFGYSKTEAMHQKVADLIIPANQRAGHLHGMERYLSTGVSHVMGKRLKVQAMHRDGHEFPVELAITIYSGIGNQYFISFLRDLTEETTAAANIEILRAELLQLSRLNAMGTAASMIAHELNQPLAAASNYLAACQHLASRVEVDENFHLQESLAMVQDAIVRAATVVKTVREVIAKPITPHEPIDLKILMQATVKFVERISPVPIEIRLAPDAMFVAANKGQIEQVLLNLIKNAAEAILGQPSPKIVCSSKRIGQRVAICIQDNGPGL